MPDRTALESRAADRPCNHGGSATSVWLSWSLATDLGFPRCPWGDSGWRRRQPEKSALYRLLARHLHTYLEQAALSSQGSGVPWFVKRELESFLSCGILARGFLRVRCPACRTDQVVAFSCKKRGVCPSCCARRMADTAAHLVDHVLPDVPIRQWVLTFPFRLRYLLAYNAKLCRAVRKVSIRALLTFLRRSARKFGIDDGHSGAVCSLQRAGGSINSHVHLHVLALDGVFFKPADGLDLDDQHLPAPRESEVQRLLETIRSRVDRLLRRWGLDEGADAEAGADDSGWSRSRGVRKLHRRESRAPPTPAPVNQGSEVGAVAWELAAQAGPIGAGPARGQSEGVDRLRPAIEGQRG
ncbi:MAG: transposase zinc-binding domain-containing protein [Planctomycetota bacterium]